MKTIKAVFKTGSNYKNCNGKALEVIRFNGSTIDCKVPYYGFNPETDEAEGDRMVTSGFFVSELVSIFNEL